MSRTAAGFAFVLSFIAASAHAQPAPFPGAVNINGGWVPCSHPIALAAGRSCAEVPATVTPTIPTAFISPQCNPYDVDQLANAPECQTFRHPVAPPVTRLDDFRVGNYYADPYGGRVRVLMEGVKTTASEKFWVLECVNVEGSCRNVGVILTRETRTPFLLDAGPILATPSHGGW